MFPTTIKIMEIYHSYNIKITNFPLNLETLILSNDYNHKINFELMGKLKFVSAWKKISKSLSDGKIETVYFTSTRSLISFHILLLNVKTIILSNISEMKEKIINLPCNFDTIQMYCDDEKTLENINAHLNKKYKELDIVSIRKSQI